MSELKALEDSIKAYATPQPDAWKRRICELIKGREREVKAACNPSLVTEKVSIPLNTHDELHQVLPDMIEEYIKTLLPVITAKIVTNDSQMDGRESWLTLEFEKSFAKRKRCLE